LGKVSEYLEYFLLWRLLSVKRDGYSIISEKLIDMGTYFIYRRWPTIVANTPHNQIKYIKLESVAQIKLFLFVCYVTFVSLL
jgi:hypothetical protein